MPSPASLKPSIGHENFTQPEWSVGSPRQSRTLEVRQSEAGDCEKRPEGEVPVSDGFCFLMCFEMYWEGEQ